MKTSMELKLAVSGKLKKKVSQLVSMTDLNLCSVLLIVVEFETSCVAKLGNGLKDVWR